MSVAAECVNLALQTHYEYSDSARRLVIENTSWVKKEAVQKEKKQAVCVCFHVISDMCVLAIVSNSLFKLLPPCNNEGVWLQNEIAVYGLLMHPI